jgi:anti-sigma factor RsiW
MTCREFERRIALYAGGDLPVSEVAMVEHHLAGCADCAELAASLAADRDRLRARPPETAEVDFDAMRRELRSRIVRGQQVRRWVSVMAVAAALLAAVLVPGRTGRRIVRPVDADRHAAMAAPVMTPAPEKTTTILASNSVPKPRQTPAGKTGGERRAAVLQSDVQMRLTTGDPNVMIILLPVTTENPNE